MNIIQISILCGTSAVDRSQYIFLTLRNYDSKKYLHLCCDDLEYSLSGPIFTISKFSYIFLPNEPIQSYANERIAQ